MSSNQPPNPEQQIQQAIERVASESALNQPGAFPLEVSIPGTPQKFTGNTPQEVLDQLVNAQANATRTIAEERTKRAELESQLTQLRAATPAPPADDQKARIEDRYNTWAKNPTEATKQDLADLLGISPDRVIDVMKEAIGGGVVSRAADEFTMRCPDFPQTPQNAAMMKNALSARFGASMEAASADNLEIVYHQLVREGRITPNGLPAQRLENAVQPVPTLRGGSAPPSPLQDVYSQAHQMPLDQLRQVIDRLYSQQR